MSNVTVTIAGRQYAIACAEGEEEHVRELGRTIDAKLDAMGGAGSQTETRNLLFASLLLADEVHEMRRGGGSPMPAQPAAPAQTGSADDGRLADKLEALATRLESCAEALEG